MNNEIWLLTGEYENGDDYFEVFNNLFDVTETIDDIYHDYVVLGKRRPDKTINPFTLQMEYDG